jgi:hypothetical protein
MGFGTTILWLHQNDLLWFVLALTLQVELCVNVGRLLLRVWHNYAIFRASNGRHVQVIQRLRAREPYLLASMTYAVLAIVSNPRSKIQNLRPRVTMATRPTFMTTNIVS